MNSDNFQKFLFHWAIIYCRQLKWNLRWKDFLKLFNHTLSKLKTNWRLVGCVATAFQVPKIYPRVLEILPFAWAWTLTTANNESNRVRNFLIIVLRQAHLKVLLNKYKTIIIMSFYAMSCRKSQAVIFSASEFTTF